MAWMQLQPQELLAAVQVPVATGWRSAYEKVRVRGSIDFALAGAAVALHRDGDQLAGLRVAPLAWPRGRYCWKVWTR